MRRADGRAGFDAKLRKLYFDTVLYNVEALDLLFRIVGPWSAARVTSSIASPTSQSGTAARGISRSGSAEAHSVRKSL